MALYLVESFDYLVDHDGCRSQGVVGRGGSEKVYLHIIDVTDADIARLGPRIDDHGNQQHDRLALPNNDEWWIAVEGQTVWPRTNQPRLTSRCTLDGGVPRPVALGDVDRAELMRLGVKLPG